MKLRASYSTCYLTFKKGLLDDRECFGECLYDDNEGVVRIYIEKSLTGPELATTLLHELGHWAYHLWKPKKEEITVTVLSAFYVEVMQRNKRLREMILENLE